MKKAILTSVLLVSLFFVPQLVSALSNTIFTDGGGLKLLELESVEEAVNWVKIQNAATESEVDISAVGADENVQLALHGKGQGMVNVGDVIYVDGDTGVAYVESLLDLNSGLLLGYANWFGNPPVVGQSTIFGLDTTSARTVTLESSFIAYEGGVVIVKDEDGLAATNNITIVTEGSELIDGAATKVINTNYGSVRLYTNGSNVYTF